MKKLIIITLIFFAFSNSYSQEISFSTSNWSEAVALAKKDHKLIFVDLYAVWCAPCKAMAKNVFTKPKVAEVYNRSFINIKLDGEKGEGAKLYEKYQVQSYPTYLFIDGNGKLVRKIEGALDAEKFIGEGEKAIKEAN